MRFISYLPWRIVQAFTFLSGKMKLVYVFLLLSIFCLDKVATTWCHKPYLQRHMRFITGASSNESLLSIAAKPANDEMIDHVSSFLYGTFTFHKNNYIIYHVIFILLILFWNKNQLRPYSNENHNPRSMQINLLLF
jgi:hypothetical protein